MGQVLYRQQNYFPHLMESTEINSRRRHDALGKTENQVDLREDVWSKELKVKKKEAKTIGCIEAV